MMDSVVVSKLNPAGQETWRYTGHILDRGPHYIVLEAEFNRDDTPFHDILLRRGDRFIETYYTDRWYNIYEMHDRDDDRLKGWYCNIGRPAEVGKGVISFVDLALDLLVYPDGRQLVLDEDEFAELDLSPEEQQQARQALEELKTSFNKRFTSRGEAD